jgi:hypothetical protein
MELIKGNDVSVLPLINAAPRALVFLSVPWSVPERTARHAFQKAIDQIAPLNVKCFVLDEDADWCPSWLIALQIHGLEHGWPQGAGSMIWMELGKVISSELGGCQLSTKDIVARTEQIWQHK